MSVKKRLGQNVLCTVHLDLKSKRYDFEVRASYSGTFGYNRNISAFGGRPPQPRNTLGKGCSIGFEPAHFLIG